MVQTDLDLGRIVRAIVREELAAPSKSNGRQPRLPDDSIVRAKVEKNPRRPGTHGHRSLNLAIEAGESSLGDLCAKGARRVDLYYDADRGRVSITPPH